MDEDQQQPAPPPTSALSQYMQQYSQRLQSAITDNVDSMGTPQVPQGGDLGPDMYQSNIRFAQDRPPPQSALQQSPQPGAPAGGPPPQSALGAGQADPNAGQDSLDADSGKQTSFKDLWDQQSHQQRQQFIDKLQGHLDKTNETINSAYDKMMEQLGQRPQTDLTKQDKGMYLMEFGLRMLSHSAGENTSQAIGNAGTETLDSYKQQRSAKMAQQQQYDKMQQQLTQAHDRDTVNLASRSALEEGRDLRSAQASDASITRMQMQQSGQDSRQSSKNAAGADRTNARDSSALGRTQIQQQGANYRAGVNANQVKGTITGADGFMYGLDKNGKMTKLTDQDGNAVKPAPGQSGLGSGGKKSASQQNFDMYMSVYGVGKDGQPLQGADLQAAQQKALNYSANPKALSQMGETQMRQIAQKSADTLVRGNPTAWLGMSPDDIAKKQAEFSNNIYLRLKRGQPPLAESQGPGPSRPQSALDDGSGAAPPAPQAPGGPPQSALGQPPARANPAPPGRAPVPQTPMANQPRGAVPTQPQPGKPTPNAGQLQLLQQNPQQARFFLAKFGYLPAGFQRYLQPQSALH